MTELHRTRVTLRIVGDDLDPAEVTRLLGAEPTASSRKGEMRPTGAGREVATLCGSWRLGIADASPGDLDAQVGTLLAGLTDDLSVWRDLCRRYRCEMFCGLFMRDGNEGVTVGPGILAKLGERGLHIDLDIYGPPS